jgi:glycosyltransferase involved in cell wall biosynthesis
MKNTLYEKKDEKLEKVDVSKTGLLFLSSFPPRECGIATYTTDLIVALQNKFNGSFDIQVVPLETQEEHYLYDNDPKFILDTSNKGSYIELADHINTSPEIDIVFVQHEFGLFSHQEDMFTLFLQLLKKDIVITFHTVLPHPSAEMREQVRAITHVCNSVIVMTNSSAEILIGDYDIEKEKIAIIPHGTHLLPARDKVELKKKYGLTDKKVLCTFGLLSSGKNIETTLNALPEIIRKNPDVIFLIIGKTHPSIIKKEGEVYRDSLAATVQKLQLEDHVIFVNQYLATEELLEYLLLTDIYLFTSNDRNQAVSGTFSYAISSGCPIISTPIPHVLEVLKKDMGIIIDFEAADQLAEAANRILENKGILERLSLNNLQKMVSTSWQNAALSHAQLFDTMNITNLPLQYALPEVNLDHIKRMTTAFGMIQFSKTSTPDLSSGYTLDDNARALVAVCQHYELYSNKNDLNLIKIYLNFISFCFQENGKFLNYVDSDKLFTPQNDEVNLDDSNGRAMWALGYVMSLTKILPKEISDKAGDLFDKALPKLEKIHSTRSIAFILKGLCLVDTLDKTKSVKMLADRLVAMYTNEAEESWQWFESYLTYGNSVLSEALLCAYIYTGEQKYKDVAQSSFDFLLSKIFRDDEIHVISNKGWAHKGIPENESIGGEQPIDITYTILALDRFYKVFGEEEYAIKLKQAFDWFLGKNHLKQIVYNPVTAGCYDGIEEKYINLNQGAESTVSYLMARLVMEKNTPFLLGS